MARFDQALTREMAAMSASSFAALTSIFLVVVLVRVLGKAAMGDLEVEAVLPMLALGVFQFLPVLLSLGIFIGVFMCLSRVWRDSEAVIWMGGGIGPVRWIQPVLLFTTPMVALIALVSFIGLPWAAELKSDYERILKSRDEISSLAPGMFTEFGDGKRVHFVETVSSDARTVENLFVQTQTQGRTGVMVASKGHVETLPGGERFLELEKGRRYVGSPGDADFRMGEFDSYAVRIQPQALADVSVQSRMLTTGQLLDQPTPGNMGELVTRLSYPVSALLLALLAVPMSYVNPRAGRSLNVVFAILIYVAYNNFVGLSEGWVSRGQLNAGEALSLVHGGMLLILVAFYWQRFKGPWAR